MKLKKALCALVISASISGCSIGLNTLRVMIKEDKRPVVSMDIKVKDFNLDRIYYSLGINISGAGQYLDRDGNGYLDPKDFEESYQFMTNGSLEKKIRKYFADRYSKDTTKCKIIYKLR
jgi:hypothetical protein